MNGTIKTILRYWQDRDLPRTIARDIDIERFIGLKPRKIIVITGFRRVGKTYLLYHGVNQHLFGVDRERTVYINFEDERIPKRKKFLTELIPTIKETYSGDPDYLLLDEIQDMPDWSRWLRRLHDSEEMDIIVTGSSSKVSSREIPTELRGRCLEIKVFPLSFREFLRFRHVGEDIDSKDVEHSEKMKVLIRKALNEYLRYGGMPEVVLSPEMMRFEILHQYYHTVFRRDIIERHNVRNEEVLKVLMNLLLNSTQYTISKMYNTLKSLQYKIGKTTLLNYLAYIEQSYFINSLLIYSPKVKDRLQYPRKVYFIDNGFISSLSTKMGENTGRLFENVVAVELDRRSVAERTELFYWKNVQGHEVDFVVKRDTRVQQLIQVCYDISDIDTEKREIRAIVSASKELGCKDLLIITNDLEKTEKKQGRRIQFIPLWKWLLRK